ncbi:hypothetical protein F4781DRAFT_416019 [Annulohypoxylon bovei var. microspora]|nr:hypothetical protein F4781DRAFT_416019 [Annulohypoxylon bovei var. microspora]
MQSYVRHVIVDGVATDVAQYAFAKKAFFVLSATAGHNSWPQLCSQTLDSIWLLALRCHNPSNSAPNQWKIALELKSTKMITTELYNTQEARGTIFLVRTFTDDPHAERFSDWKKLTTNGICHAGRRMNSGVTLQDVILKVQAENLLTYQLKDGRGSRFWVTAILSTIGQFIHEATRTARMDREADGLG